MAALSTSGAAIISEIVSEASKGGGRRRVRWPGWVMLIAGGGGFAAVAADLMYHGALQRADLPLQSALHRNSTPGLTLLFSGISGMGELFVIVCIAVVVGAALIVRKRWWSLGMWAMALAGSGIINPVLKNIFRVPRPERFTFYNFNEGGFSFPSGHTMAVAITAGAMVLVMMHEAAWPRGRRVLAGLGVGLLSVLEAFALLYVGVHYLTDVLAGLAVSMAWLGVIRLLLPPKDGELKNPV